MDFNHCQHCLNIFILCHSLHPSFKVIDSQNRVVAYSETASLGVIDKKEARPNRFILHFRYFNLS